MGFVQILSFFLGGRWRMDCSGHT